MVCLGRPHHFKIFKDCLPQRERERKREKERERERQRETERDWERQRETERQRDREISSMKWVNRISENVKYPVPKLKWNMKLLKLIKYNCKTKDFHINAAAFQFHWLHLFGTVDVLHLLVSVHYLNHKWNAKVDWWLVITRPSSANKIFSLYSIRNFSRWPIF